MPCAFPISQAAVPFEPNDLPRLVVKPSAFSRSDSARQLRPCARSALILASTVTVLAVAFGAADLAAVFLAAGSLTSASFVAGLAVVFLAGLGVVTWLFAA